MLNTENAVIEILPGKVDDSTAREVYRNLQVLYGTVAGEQALDREFGIDGSIIDCPQERMRKFSWLQNMCAKPNGMSRGQRWPAWNGRAERRRTEL